MLVVAVGERACRRQTVRLQIMTRRRYVILSAFTVGIMGAAAAQAEVLIGLASPLTGRMAWLGEQHQRPVEMAVAEINAAGGLLGQPIEVVTADDYCNAEQAIAAANKLVAAGVTLVVGHGCSGAAIPASRVYEEAGVVMISHAASNPKLTDQGFRHIFRMVARDTVQGQMAAAYLAEHRADRRIAILHDGEGYGRGLAEVTKAELNQRGVSEVLYEQITPGQPDYSDTLARLRAAGIDVLFYGGYPAEAALLIRQARDRSYDLELIGSDALVTEYFWHVAGPAAVGVRFVSMADPRTNVEAAPIVEKFRAEGYEPEGFTLYSYAAVQVWAQAVEKAGTFDSDAVAEGLHSLEFDTVLGRIGFDDKGDVYGYEPFAWYVWQDGDYAPLEPDSASK
jgi:branched-chain amino acid transport system substrate-binding protein